jgi:colicin import membrane protein
MNERRGDRALSIVLSIFIHAAILAALVWGWWKYRSPTPSAQNLAIEGTVVHSAQPAPTPAPPAAAPPTPPVEQPAAPTPEPPDQQAEQKAREEQEQKKKVEEQKAAEAKRAEDEQRAAAEAAENQRKREEAEKAVAQKAEADRKAEEQRKAEAARKAQELAQQKKADEERAQREADLRAQLAAEEHANAVQASPARAEYLSLITARINRAWIRPPSARSGVKCTVHITQIPGGVITHVGVTGCNGDEAVRQSVETAAYRASPLPAPSDPALFDPNIDVTFAPDE